MAELKGSITKDAERQDYLFVLFNSCPGRKYDFIYLSRTQQRLLFQHLPQSKQFRGQLIIIYSTINSVLLRSLH